MGNCTLENGNLDQILLCCLNTLGNGGSNLASLAQAVTNDTLTVTNHYNSSESESTATLGNLDNTIDSNQSILNSSVFTFTLFAIILIRI